MPKTKKTISNPTPKDRRPASTARKTINIPGESRVTTTDVSKAVTTARPETVKGRPNWNAKAFVAAERIAGWLKNPKVKIAQMVKWTGTSRAFIQEVAEVYGLEMPNEPEPKGDGWYWGCGEIRPIRSKVDEIGTQKVRR